MTPTLTDPAARLLWKAYFAEVDHLLARAPSDMASLRDDLAAHLAESMAAAHVGSERDRLEAALVRLGRPIDYLRPILSDELIERGTRTYSPLIIARGLGHAVLAGSRRAAIASAFGLGYLLLGIFAAAAVLKPFWSDHVGLFRHADGTLSAGIVSGDVGGHELLGWASIPLALAMAGLLYVGLTRGLRAVRQRR